MAQITVELTTIRRWYYPLLIGASYAILWVAVLLLADKAVDHLINWLATKTVDWGVKVEAH
jgi:hypothetical protein